MEPSLEVGGGDREENDSGKAGDHFTGNVHHPLFDELVMEVLFKKFLLLKHDDSSKSSLAHLTQLRSVCKTWNWSIGRMIRKKSWINVKKLIAAYPEGLGWTATTNAGNDQDDMSFQYGAPMPQAIGTFENLTVTIKTCTDFQDTSVLKWFQMMGSSVKSLRLNCPLNCYHQNIFVEKVLKEWCPKLVSLTIRGIECFESLIQNSFFAQPTLENQCGSLQEFILFDGSLRNDLKLNWLSKSCGLTIDVLGKPEDGTFQAIDVRKNIHERRSAFVEDLINYVDRFSENSTAGADLLKKLVRRPIGLTSLDGLIPPTFGCHVADFFQKKFSCDPGHENDGGIIGQLMKMSGIEKLVIQKGAWFFNELLAMFFFRPNLWRSTLQHFECLDSHGASTAYRTGWMPHARSKKFFSEVGFPLKTLKLVRGAFGYGKTFDLENMGRILSRYAETLEELECRLGANEFERRLTLPVLPKLKVLTFQGDENCWVKVSSQEILRKLPKLERCHVIGTSYKCKWAASSSFADGGPLWVRGSHPLKEIKVLDGHVGKKGIDGVVRCFPNLKIVDVTIQQETGEEIRGVWEKMGELSLEQIKITLSVSRSMWGSFGNPYEMRIEDNIGGFKDLKWLEFANKARHPFLLTSRLSKIFAKMNKLKVLTFANFKVVENEAEEIQEKLANVFVQQLPAPPYK